MYEMVRWRSAPITQLHLYENIQMSDQAQAGKTVVISSADAEICRRIRVAMEGEGYRCLSAPNGITALSLLSEQPVALVLADTETGGLGAVELLEQVGAHGPGVYVILMAGPDEIPTLARATSVGTSDFLSKLFTSEQLVSRVRDAERRRSSRSPAGRRATDKPVEHLERGVRDLTEGVMTALSAIMGFTYPET